MTVTAWTISAKKLDSGIKYVKPYQRFELEKQDFLMTTLLEEVKHEKKRNLKKYAKICKVTIVTAALLLTIVHPTFAATIPGAQLVASNLPAPLPTTIPNSILPSDIVKVGVVLIGLSTAASSILAVVLAQLAGGYRMLRKGDEATKWTTDIIKGYTQVLVAPFLIGAIAFVVYLLFGSYDWFLNIF